MKLLSQILLPLGVGCALGGLAMDQLTVQLYLFAGATVCLFLHNCLQSKQQEKQWNQLLSTVKNEEALKGIEELQVQFEHQLNGQEETRRQMVEAVDSMKKEVTSLLQAQETFLNVQRQEEKESNTLMQELQAEQIEFWERQHKNNNVLVDGLKHQNELLEQWKAMEDKSNQAHSEQFTKHQETLDALLKERQENHREVLVESVKVLEALVKQEQLQEEAVEQQDNLNKQIQGVAMQLVALSQTLGEGVSISGAIKNQMDKQDTLQTQILANAKLLEDTLSEKSGLILVQGNESQVSVNRHFEQLLQQQKTVVSTMEAQKVATEQVLREEGRSVAGECQNIATLVSSLDQKFIEMSQWESTIEMVSNMLQAQGEHSETQLAFQEKMVENLVEHMDETWKNSVLAIKEEMSQTLDEMNRREESISTVLSEMQVQYKQFETMVHHMTSTMMTMSVEDNKLLHKIFQ